MRQIDKLAAIKTFSLGDRHSLTQLGFAKGEITKEQYEEMRKTLE
jgi:uncharacterized membrane protein